MEVNNVKVSQNKEKKFIRLKTLGVFNKYPFAVLADQSEKVIKAKWTLAKSEMMNGRILVTEGVFNLKYFRIFKGNLETYNSFRKKWEIEEMDNYYEINEIDFHINEYWLITDIKEIILNRIER